MHLPLRIPENGLTNMNMRSLPVKALPFLLSNFVLAIALAHAATPSDAEQAHAAAWLEQHMSETASPPFSLVIDGAPFADARDSWQRAVAPVVDDNGASLHMVTFTDPSNGLVLTYTVRHFVAHAAVELLLEIQNTGSSDSPILESVRVLETALPVSSDRCVLHRALGESNSEQSFASVQESLAPAMSEPRMVAPVGGRSSDTEMPFFNIQTGGGGVVVAVGWAGQWEARFLRATTEAVRVSVGQQDSHFILHPGEKARTPRVLLQFWDGDDTLRGNNLFRQWMSACNLPRRKGGLVFPPICGSVTKTDPDGSYEGPHVRMMPALAAHGFEVFWSDMDPQQWYPIGFPEGTGTWEPDPAKYPNGLKPVGDAARAAGLEYLLWFEPERVVHGTRVDQLHPEWVTYPASDPNAFGLFRLDIPEAREWLTDYVDKQVTESGISWMRWDFNMPPLEYWRQNDAPDRRGITEMRHVEGLYAMWQDLMQRHPGLVIDICASGGRRIDFETLRYGLPLWHSDMQCFGPKPEADQLQNGGLNLWLPLHGCGNFGLEPDYRFRSAMTAGNVLVDGRVFGLIDGCDDATAEALRQTIALYTKVRPYMIGDFYPLFPHDVSPGAWYGYQFHRPDLSEGCAFVFRRAECPESTEVHLQDIAPDAEYVVSTASAPDAQTMPGNTLTALPVAVHEAPGSEVVFYRRRP